MILSLHGSGSSGWEICSLICILTIMLLIEKCYFLCVFYFAHKIFI